MTRSPGSGSAEPGCRLARCEALNTKVGREPPRGAAVPPHYACMEKQTNKNISNAPPARRAPAPRAPSLPAFSFLHSLWPFARPPFPAFREADACGRHLKLKQQTSPWQLTGTWATHRETEMQMALEPTHSPPRWCPHTSWSLRPANKPQRCPVSPHTQTSPQRRGQHPRCHLRHAPGSQG